MNIYKHKELLPTYYTLIAFFNKEGTSCDKRQWTIKESFTYNVMPIAKFEILEIKD